jgi:CheY-like chemotaxis protein
MPSNVKVLLVDDNPMVLGMLRQSLSPLAVVSTAADGADALLKAVDDPPDLLISDYRMPGMDGRQLVEKLRGRVSTAGIAVILFAAKGDIAERLHLQPPAEDVLEKPFFLRDATQRIKRIIDKIALEKMAKSAPGESVLRGTLAQMNVIDLLQSLEMGRKSCLLSLTNAGDRCDLYITDGQIKHATYGKLQGDEAVYKVMAWSKGSFQIDFEGRAAQQSTTQSTQMLMMEGLRMLDESRRDDAEGAEDDVLLDS